MSLSSISWDSPGTLIAQSFVSSRSPHFTVLSEQVLAATLNPHQLFAALLSASPDRAGHLLIGWLPWGVDSISYGNEGLRLGCVQNRYCMLVDEGSCWLSGEESSQDEDTWHAFNNPWGVRNSTVKSLTADTLVVWYTTAAIKEVWRVSALEPLTDSS